MPSVGLQRMQSGMEVKKKKKKKRMFRSEEMDSHSLSPVFKLVWKVLSQVDGGYP